MSTQASNALNRDNPRDRIVIKANAKDWWDDTNKRWKSGYVTVSLSALSWTPTTPGGSEKLRVVYRAYNDNPDNDDRTEAVYAVNGSQPSSLGLTLVVAVNAHGGGIVVSPSARLEEDGTVCLSCIDLSLENYALTGATDVTGLVATATYTLTNTVIDAYAALTDPTEYTPALGVHEKRSADWCVVSLAGLPAYGAVAVQLGGLAVTKVDRGTPPGLAPRFALTTAPQSVGPVAVYDRQLSDAPASSPAEVYPPTFVFAVNGSKPDGHASRMCTPDGAGYALCNVSLVKPASTPAKVDVTPTLRYQTYE